VFREFTIFRQEKNQMKLSTLSLICLVALLCIGLATPSAIAIDGPLASATVSFGLWQTDPPFDRTLPPLLPPATQGPNDRTRNEHQLIPNEVKIKAGGAVNFIISGFHQILVYDDGTQLDAFDVVTTPTVPPQAQPTPLLIDEPDNRIYRGLDPSRQPRYHTIATDTVPIGFVQDRVEVVHFPNPGRYLVICGVHGHFFNDGMFGFVRVLPGK
jgi:plastocyanin